jgi:diguanylate cyclase (GGDEF)-like protein
LTESKIQAYDLELRIAKKSVKAVILICVIMLPLTFLSLYSNGYNSLHLVHIVFLVLGLSTLIGETKKNVVFDSLIVTMFFSFLTLFGAYKIGLNSGVVALLLVTSLFLLAVHSLKISLMYTIPCFTLLISIVASRGENDLSELVAGIVSGNTQGYMLLSIVGILISFLFVFIMFYEYRKALAKTLDELDLKESESEYLANHDRLTGLSSVRLAQEQLDLTLKMAKRHEFKAAILHIDIDEFRLINEALGLEAGDHALKEVSKRIREMIRDTDIACRQCGDEFLVSLHFPVSIEACDQICKRLIAAFDHQVPYKDHQLKINLSIGVAIYPDHGDNQFELKNKADKAMKESEKNQKSYYTFAEKV